MSNSNVEIPILESSSLARGKRLKTARMMTGLTRDAFRQKHGISASTIQSWESAKAGGLTERGANRVLPALHKEGIACTIDWLLYGIGNGPQPTSNVLLSLSSQQTEASSLYETRLQHSASSEDWAIIQELSAFRHLHPNAADLLVSDDGMEPHYHVGDYVAGIWYSEEKIAEALDADCIVKTAKNITLFRRLKKGSQPGLYNLMCTNPSTTVFKTTLYNQSLISVAPVVWHRRRNIF